jgi:hypothetical protein
MAIIPSPTANGWLLPEAKDSWHVALQHLLHFDHCLLQLSVAALFVSD